VLVPVPVVVVPPGVLVNVHVPVAGKPFRSTLPVGTAQVGCVIVPTSGAGGPDEAIITTFADAPEMQPKASVTVNVYVPAGRRVIVVVVPDPG